MPTCTLPLAPAQGAPIKCSSIRFQCLLHCGTQRSDGQGSTGSEGQLVLDVDLSPVQRSTSAVPSLFPLGDPTLSALGPWAVVSASTE